MAPLQKLKFSTTLLQSGKTATGIVIPDQVIEKLNAGKKPAVKVTINGFTYRSTVAVMGGAFMVGVSAENRAGAKVNGGDLIDVTIELDTAPREVEIPAEFKKALDKNAKAKKVFETLSNSRKKALTLPIANAKAAETKQRNITKAIDALTGDGK
ncbi:YdeI/OmpD-associated family protein [Niabella aurantiaca]|uniref:YdeI/OmpD-associated family protein n=1 Tax=Niabella aurantiaca TaxID=379900 RepID=UPI00037DED51|nr:YdeI/OmpD-associated family protein [Niabella aurantiaca]